MFTRIQDLKGYGLESRDGEIGSVKEFYFDDRFWTIRYLVAETGKWLSRKSVLLSPYSLLAVNQEEEKIAVDLTKKQIEDSPPLESDKPVSRQFEASYYDYFGWPAYWSGSYAWGMYPIIIREPEKRKGIMVDEKKWSPDLRSTAEICGYTIQSINGEIGHVEDYVINTETWDIQYMIVDTHNWLPGKKVLVSPKWIQRVSWEESKVFVTLSRESIEQAPEYSKNILFSQFYIDKLKEHYERVGST